MDFGKAVTFSFNDPDWLKKIAITGLIGLIPVVGGLYVFGWAMEVLRRAISNMSAVMLPEEVDFGGYIKQGFQAFVIAFVYSLPMSIASGAISGITAFPELLNDQDMQMVVIAVMVCCGCLAFILGIVQGLLVPAALAKFVEDGSLGAGFKVGEIFGLVKGAIGAYLLVILFQLIVGLVLGLAVMITCGLGLIIAMPLAMAIQSHLYAQAYQKAKLAR